mmetsp:Transcript_23163/g.50622  ORF Transcript_23163/g.50622 Transcript_23163/m.50622 type:complete len:205 (+) Transcript_23163:662-1276(+)
MRPPEIFSLPDTRLSVLLEVFSPVDSHFDTRCGGAYAPLDRHPPDPRSSVSTYKKFPDVSRWRFANRFDRDYLASLRVWLANLALEIFQRPSKCQCQRIWPPAPTLRLTVVVSIHTQDSSDLGRRHLRARSHGRFLVRCHRHCSSCSKVFGERFPPIPEASPSLFRAVLQCLPDAFALFRVRAFDPILPAAIHLDEPFLRPVGF